MRVITVLTLELLNLPCTKGNQKSALPKGPLNHSLLKPISRHPSKRHNWGYGLSSLLLTHPWLTSSIICECQQSGSEIGAIPTES